jgi:hypothetical protein
MIYTISRVISTELYLALSSFVNQYNAPYDIIRVIYGIITTIMDIPALEMKYDVCEELSKFCHKKIEVINNIITFHEPSYSNSLYRNRNPLFDTEPIEYKSIFMGITFDEDVFYVYKKNRYSTKAGFEKSLSQRLDMIVPTMDGNRTKYIQIERRFGSDGILQSKHGSKKYVKRNCILSHKSIQIAPY